MILAGFELRLGRKVLRGLLLIAVTLVHYLWVVAALVVLLPAPSLRRRSRNVLFHSWSRICLRILGGRLKSEGEPPKAPFFLVANHLSYMDILVLASVLDCFFIAKAEIRSWPLLGILARTVGTIFVDRTLRRDVQRVNTLVGRTLAQGYGVVLFPEGTSGQGHEVMPYRSSLLAYPAELEMEVHSASLSYRTPPGEVPAHLSICWWGDAPFGPHFWQLMGVSRFDAWVKFLPEPVRDGERKELARLLHDLSSRDLEPVVSPAQRAEHHGL